MSPGTGVLLIAPLAAAGLVAALDSDSINGATERVEAWARGWLVRPAASRSTFSKFVLMPPVWAVVRFCDWTDGFSHRGAKNGARVAAALYLLGAWVFVLYAILMLVVMIVIAAVILYVVFKVAVNADPDIRRGYERGRALFGSSARRPPDVIDQVGLRGKRVYSGTNWLSEELEGRVDENGFIYRGTNWLTEERIGRIDEDGNILRGTNWLNEEKVGRIDEEGGIHRGANWFTEERSGRMDDEGNIYKGANWFTEEKRGRAGE